jgi:hypothetical protein
LILGVLGFGFAREKDDGWITEWCMIQRRCWRTLSLQSLHFCFCGFWIVGFTSSRDRDGEMDSSVLVEDCEKVVL